MNQKQITFAKRKRYKTKQALKYFEAVTPEETSITRQLAKVFAKQPQWIKQKIAQLKTFKVIVARSLQDAQAKLPPKLGRLSPQTILSGGAIHTASHCNTEHYVLMAKAQPYFTLDCIQKNKEGNKKFSKKALQKTFLEELAHTIDDTRANATSDGQTYSQTPEFIAAYEKDMTMIRQSLTSKKLDPKPFVEAVLLNGALGTELQNLIQNNGYLALRTGLLMLANVSVNPEQARRECFAKTAVSVLSKQKPLYPQKNRHSLLLTQIIKPIERWEAASFNSWVHCEYAAYQHYFPNVWRYINRLIHQ